jgi:RNA polymerase sigma-70 factor (ECF subfamily)
MTTEQIWKEYAEGILKYFQSKVHDTQLAEDLRQEVFLKVHDHLPELKEDDKVDRWLKVIARNAVVDYWKSNGKQVSSELVLDHDFEYRFDHLANECIHKMLGSLPTKYGEPLQWSDLDGMGQHEVATKLNLGYSATKSRIQRGRSMLKDALVQCCKVKVNERNELVDADCQSGSCTSM